MASKGNLSEQPVPRTRACAVCVRPRAGKQREESTTGFEVLMVQLFDKVSGRLFLTPPGGAIENGESPSAAALRETLEETGYIVQLMSNVFQAPDSQEILRGSLVRYDFTWEGHVYDCTTTFFLCELADPAQEPRAVSDAIYNRGAKWIPAEMVSEALAFMPVPRDAVVASLRVWLKG